MRTSIRQTRGPDSRDAESVLGMDCSAAPAAFRGYYLPRRRANRDSSIEVPSLPRGHIPTKRRGDCNERTIDPPCPARHETRSGPRRRCAPVWADLSDPPIDQRAASSGASTRRTVSPAQRASAQDRVREFLNRRRISCFHLLYFSLSKNFSFSNSCIKLRSTKFSGLTVGRFSSSSTALVSSRVVNGRGWINRSEYW